MGCASALDEGTPASLRTNLPRRSDPAGLFVAQVAPLGSVGKTLSSPAYRLPMQSGCAAFLFRQVLF